jgi:3',5'-cyclic-AMP phosphodiesterase
MGLVIKHQKIIFILLVTSMLSCDPWFAFSPYEAQLDDTYHGTTEKNLSLIDAMDADDSKALRVAVISDTHYHFGKLRDAIRHVNEAGDYDFAIVTGDLTENGLKQEFIFFYQAMAALGIPYVTAIGNHDYLSNGEEIYSQMFGQYNYTFVYNNVKMVIFDNTTYESEKEPDLAWLDQALDNEGGYDHVIPFSHIPPFDGQMAKYREDFHMLMLKHNISTSIHGHKHDFSITEHSSGIKYVTASSPQKRTYTRLTITPAEIEIEKIEY